MVSDDGHSAVDRGQTMVDHGQPPNHGQQESREAILVNIYSIMWIKFLSQIFALKRNPETKNREDLSYSKAIMLFNGSYSMIIIK